MVDSPVLDQKERVGTGMSATINASAMSIGWLQDGLDYFHHRFPMGGTVTSTVFNLVVGTGSYTLPADYILDFQDGVTYNTPERGRMQRKSLAAILAFSTLDIGKPYSYTIVGTGIRFRPYPDKTYSVNLNYYALPAALSSGTVPQFPSDLVLVRYVYLRGLEWVRAVPPGTAEQYANTVIADLQKSGIGLEHEADRIPFDRVAYPGNFSGWGNDPVSWMGVPIVGS